MSMDAELLAIGKYPPDIREHLGYPPGFYDDPLEGATIITSVGSCCTPSGSKLLAEASGIAPWAFGQHCDIAGENADLEQLEQAFENGMDSVIRFIALREHGFRFYYLPGG